MPEEFGRFRQGWIERHPSWEFRLWTDDNLPTMINRKEFDRAATLAEKSDILRYELMHQFGGIYLDTDFECFKNIEPLLGDAQCFLVDCPGTRTQGFIGGLPRHPFWREVVEKLPRQVQQNPDAATANKTGPFWLWKLVRPEHCIRVLEAKYIYPYGPREKHRRGEPFPEAYAAHHWTGSWQHPRPAPRNTTPRNTAPRNTTPRSTAMKIMYFGPNGSRPNSVVERYAKERGYECCSADYSQDMFRVADTMKYASMVVIWNGLHLNAPLAVRLCRRRGIPHAFIEQGLLPQHETLLVDPQGCGGDSILCRDLSWVTPSDLENLCRVRRELQHRYQRCDEGFVLVPLQVENDTQVLYHSAFRTMKELVATVEAMYPRQRIVVRPHPKGGTDGKPTRAEVSREGSFLDMAARASLVVGISSTCLFEAAILGVPVVALGDHPLKHCGPGETDRACAGVLALRVRRADGNLGSVLDRFTIHPQVASA